MLQAEKELLLEQVRATGQCFVRVGGFCMMPAITNKAAVRIQHRPASGLKIGDIVAYFIGAKLMVHRLIKISGDTLVVRGDSASSEIHAVAHREILGVITEIKNQPLIHRILRKAQSVWQTWTSARRTMEKAPAVNGQNR